MHTHMHTHTHVHALKGQALEEVKSFPYLGSEVPQDGKVEKEVAVRLQKAGTVYQMWR